METNNNKIETINLKDFSKLDPSNISYITLRNGNIIKLDDSSKEKPVINIFKNELFKKNLQISEKLIISFDKKEILKDKVITSNKNIKTKTTKNDLKIIKNIDFSFFAELKKNSIDYKNNKDILSRNINQHNYNKKIISISNTNKNSNTNNLEYTKNSNIYLNSNSNLKPNINKNINDNNKEENKENKEPNLINSKIKKQNQNYKERLNKLIDDLNKPTVNAVISLDIPSDIPFNISGIQRQFNKLITQLNKKKYRHNKYQGEQNYKRYYELYKNKNNKIYNGTFNHSDKRIKYFEENINLESDINRGNYMKEKSNDLFNENFNINSIIYNNYRNVKHKNKNNINKFKFNLKEINDYNYKNNTISYLFQDKKRAVSQKQQSFRDKVNKKVSRPISTIIRPSNIYKNKIKI